MRDLTDDDGRELERGGAVELGALAVPREQTLQVANLERQLHQRKRREEVVVLEPVEPLLGLPRVEPQERHGGVHVLVQRVVVAVDVVAHLVVVPPHERRPPDEIVRHAQRVVHPRLGAHRAVVPAVLNSQPDPRARQAEHRAREWSGEVGVERVARDGGAHDGRRRRVAAHPVLRLTLPREQLLAHPGTDGVVQGRIVGPGRRGNRGDGEIFEHREFAEPRGGHLRPEVVRFDERGAVASDGEVQEPLAAWVLVVEGLEVVRDVAVHGPLGVLPLGVVPRVLHVRHGDVGSRRGDGLSLLGLGDGHRRGGGDGARDEGAAGKARGSRVGGAKGHSPEIERERRGRYVSRGRD